MRFFLLKNYIFTWVWSSNSY